MKILGSHITISRGEEAYIPLKMVTMSGRKYEMGAGDRVRCQVRTKANAGKLVISGTIIYDGDDTLWHIRPEDTRSLEIGTYFWDAELIRANGDDYTFIVCSRFVLTKAVPINRKKRLIEYYPPVLQRVLEFNRLSDALDVETEIARKAIWQSLGIRYLDDDDQDAIDYLEKMYGITVDATSSLEDRRVILKILLRQYPPFTLNALKEKLVYLCGRKGFEVSIDYAHYVITVTIGLSVQKQYDAVVDMLHKIVPANMVINVQLQYNRHGKYDGVWTHEEMAAYKHVQLREEPDISHE